MKLRLKFPEYRIAKIDCITFQLRKRHEILTRCIGKWQVGKLTDANMGNDSD